MSAFAAPFGLKPLYHPSGNVRPKALDITSGYNTNIFQYSVVALNTGNVTPGVQGLILSPVDGSAIGCFLGVEFTPSDGRRRYSNNWPANQVATQIVAYYTDDVLMTYEIQASATLAENSIGSQYSVTAEAGNTTTGFSTQALDTTSGTPFASSHLLRVVGLSSGPLNNWGDAFPIVQVQISKHQFTAPLAGF